MLQIAYRIRGKARAGNRVHPSTAAGTLVCRTVCAPTSNCLRGDWCGHMRRSAHLANTRRESASEGLPGAQRCHFNPVGLIDLLV